MDVFCNKCKYSFHNSDWCRHPSNLKKSWRMIDEVCVEPCYKLNEKNDCKNYKKSRFKAFKIWYARFKDHMKD